MIFISDRPNLSIWDREKRTKLCKFENHKFETKDKRKIRVLKEMGFECEEVTEEPVKESKEEPKKAPKKKEEKLKDLTCDILRKRAKKANITGYSSMKKAELIKALKGGE